MAPKPNANRALPSAGLDFKKLETEGELLLLQLDDWYHHRDGTQYHNIWGRVRIVPAANILGFRPTGNQANWYAVVGSGEHAIIIAGCRIHYAQVCLAPPSKVNTLHVGDKS